VFSLNQTQPQSNSLFSLTSQPQQQQQQQQQQPNQIQPPTTLQGKLYISNSIKCFNQFFFLNRIRSFNECSR